MPYTTPTPSTVSAGDTFPASAYNIISADLQDHESRIKTGVESYTTAQKNALVGVTAGTTIYDSTLGLLQVWNGSAWVAATAMQFLGSYTSTGANPTFDGIFTSGWKHYHVVYSTPTTVSGGTGVQVRLRYGGTTETAITYFWMARYHYFGESALPADTDSGAGFGGSEFQACYMNDTAAGTNASELVFYNPQVSGSVTTTFWRSNRIYQGSPYNGVYVSGGGNTKKTIAYDGLLFFPGSAMTFTVNLAVYGFNT